MIDDITFVFHFNYLSQNSNKVPLPFKYISLTIMLIGLTTVMLAQTNRIEHNEKSENRPRQETAGEKAFQEQMNRDNRRTLLENRRRANEIQDQKDRDAKIERDKIIKAEKIRNSVPQVRKDAALRTRSKTGGEAYSYHVDRTSELMALEAKKVYKRMKLSQEIQSDLLKLKAELLDQSKWPTSSEAELVAYLARTINATANLIFDLMEVDPKSKIAIVPISITNTLIQSGLKNGTLTMDQAAKIITTAFLAERTEIYVPTAIVTKALLDYGASIKDMIDVPNQQKEIRKDLKRQLKIIDKLLKKYDEKVQEQKRYLKYLEQVKSPLIAYRSENPPSLPPNEEMVKFGEETRMYNVLERDLAVSLGTYFK